MRAAAGRTRGILGRGLAWAIPFAAGLIGASPGAVCQEYPVVVGEVRGVVSYTWPSMLRKGYFPVFISLDNNSASAQNVTVQAERVTGRCSVRKSFQIPPHERRRVELALPAFSDALIGPSASVYLARYSLLVQSGRDVDNVVGVGPTSNAHANSRAVLIVSQNAVNSTDCERLAELLSWERLPSNPRGTNDNVQVSAVKYDQLPARSESYSSLDCVVLTPSSSLPNVDDFEALLTWVRFGGHLAIIGPDADRLARTAPGLRGSFEPRFVEELSPKVLSVRHGLGQLRILRATFRPAEFETWGEILTLLRGSQSWIPDSFAPFPPLLEPGTEAARSFPIRTVLLILVAFVVLVGPVNFLWAKRRRTPILLVFTIPAVSAGFCAGLMVFGLWHLGLDIRVVSRSVSILDQRVHRSTTAENRAIYAGWIGAGGLRPGAGTSVFPVMRIREEDGSMAGGLWGSFLIESGDSTKLFGEYLPPRRTVVQTILTDRACRLRLSFERKGPQLSVLNGLEAPIQRLWVHDPKKTCYALPAGSALEPGASVLLDASVNPDVNRHVESLLPGLTPLPATFAAVLSRNPFVDDCGITVVTDPGFHCVIGILDPSEDNWR